MSEVAKWREHKFVMAHNNARSRRMALQHEVRARRAGVAWQMMDLGAFYHAGLGRCGICGLQVGFDEFCIDHIIPLSCGGTHTPENIQVAHIACNIRKGNRFPTNK